MSTQIVAIDRDRELAGRVLATGDEAAFRELYRAHTPRLYAFVLRILAGDERDAEDAVSGDLDPGGGETRRLPVGGPIWNVAHRNRPQRQPKHDPTPVEVPGGRRRRTAGPGESPDRTTSGSTSSGR